MKKTAIIYGDYEKEKKAIETLTKIILDFTTAYPVCVKSDEEKNLSEYTKIYIGTKETNEYIQKNSALSLKLPEEYAISAKDGVVFIEGSDSAGVLYGCADFYNKYIVSIEYTNNDGTYWENPFEKELPDFFLQSHPAVENRGIWTWGHVIYDYRDFIDNMVMLKLNSLTIWNDFVPINAKDIVSYAHEAGIKVIWGYSWFWDTDCGAIDVKKVNESIPEIIEKYEKEYLPTGVDGIYFQSFTELSEEYIGDVLIAEAVTDFVNNASREFLKKYPDTELQFGLHSDSVKEKLDFIKNVDPRVRIVWENCGAFPFWYIPTDTISLDDTIDFVEKIARLRGENDSFGVVTKGLTKLKWSSFEHLDGSCFTGVSSKRVKANRVLRKKPIWKYVDSCWFTRAGDAARAIKAMTAAKCGKLYISGLIEDGMFEENVMLPSAIFAELLWNPDEDSDKLIGEVSLRNYVEFA